MPLGVVVAVPVEESKRQLGRWSRYRVCPT
jgi:hypothetical protein